jgi:hypothetical protein
VESISAAATSIVPILRQLPCISNCGIQRRRPSPEEEFITNVINSLTNLASRSSSTPAQPQRGRRHQRRNTDRAPSVTTRTTRTLLAPRANPSQPSPQFTPRVRGDLVPLPQEDEPFYSTWSATLLTLSLVTPVISSSLSPGSTEIQGTPPQPFLPNNLYIARVIPTRNSIELRAFLNHCQYLLQGRANEIINHPLTELFSFTPHPVVFVGFLWRYRITINQTGVLEDYRLITRLNHPPGNTALRYAFTVFYDWDAEGYTVSINE